MKNRILKLLKIILITILVFSLSVPIYATELEEEQEKQENLESDLSEAQQKLKELESLKDDTYSYVKEIDSALSEINSKVAQLQSQSAEKQSQINETQAEIEEKEAEIAKQYSAMKIRIQYMYENAETGYIDMILGSDNMSDLLNKAELMAQITQYDRNMLEQIQQTKAEIEQTKAQLEQEQAEIDELKAEQEAKQDDLQVLSNEKNEQLDNYEEQISVAEELEAQLQDELEAQKSVIAELIASYDKSSGEKYTGGSMLFPLATYKSISSPYGWDTLNGSTRWHNGVDIAAAAGTPIMAAESGTVVWAQYSSSAGNYIIIYHGNGIYTEYMHCNAFNVSKGQNVTRGQVIGWVGNTGYSFGAHLHFGVATGFPPNNSNRIDPSPYIGL